MVYVQAARKTGAYMIVALMLSLAIITFTSGSMDPTGRVTSVGVVQGESESWVVFLLGIFVGALIVGTYFYVAHLEAKRKE